jgi:hypothetical protein
VGIAQVVECLLRGPGVNPSTEKKQKQKTLPLKSDLNLYLVIKEEEPPNYLTYLSLSALKEPAKK